jgi:hypothetical protein
MPPLKNNTYMNLHKRPKGTRNYTLRLTGTMTENGEVVLIYNFGTTAFVGGTTHIDANKGMWTRCSTRDINSQSATSGQPRTAQPIHSHLVWRTLCLKTLMNRDANLLAQQLALYAIRIVKKYLPSYSIHCDVTSYSFVDRFLSSTETLLLHLPSYERRMRHVHQTIRRHINEHRNFNIHIVKPPKIKLLLGCR